MDLGRFPENVDPADVRRAAQRKAFRNIFDAKVQDYCEYGPPKKRIFQITSPAQTVDSIINECRKIQELETALWKYTTTREVLSSLWAQIIEGMETTSISTRDISDDVWIQILTELQARDGNVLDYTGGPSDLAEEVRQKV